MYNLARVHREGRGVEASAEEAVSWLQKSAEAGHADAMFNLAVALQRSDGRKGVYGKINRRTTITR